MDTQPGISVANWIRTRGRAQFGVRSVPRGVRAIVLSTAIVAAGMATTCAPVAAAVPSSVQTKIANLANAQVGKGCSSYNACSRQWCATFAQWVWINADGSIYFQPITTAAKSFLDYGNRYGTTSTTPHVGDAVVFTSASGSGTVEHVAIVYSVNSNGTVTSIGGNEGGTAPTNSTVRKDTYSKTVGAYASPVGWYVYRYISPITRVTASITPSSQSIPGATSGSWTVSWAGGSGSYSLKFDYGNGRTPLTWTASAAGSKTITAVLAAPCPGDPAARFTQKFTASDAKYSSNSAGGSSLTTVNVGKMC